LTSMDLKLCLAYLIKVLFLGLIFCLDSFTKSDFAGSEAENILAGSLHFSQYKKGLA